MIKPVASYSPSFNGIYKNKDITFSEVQINIVDEAVSKLRTPDKKGKTFEDKHKKWDFYLDGEKNNSVSITAYHRTNIDNPEGQAFADFRKKVGIYNKKHPFSISDIKSAINDYRTWNILFFAGAALILSIAAGNAIMQKKTSVDNANKTEILNDSLDNSSVNFYNAGCEP